MVAEDSAKFVVDREHKTKLVRKFVSNEAKLSDERGSKRLVSLSFILLSFISSKLI